MRHILFGLAALAAAFVAQVQPSSAEGRPWCTEPRLGKFGGLDCSYATLAQCRASALGTNLSCIENPAPAWKALKERDRKERGQRGGTWNYREY